MPHDAQGFRIFGREKTKMILTALLKRGVGTDYAPIDLGGKSCFGKAGTDFGGNIDRSNTLGILTNGLVGQDDFKHFLRDT
jgi:hypothetical protein